MLEVKDINVVFGKKKAVSHVTFNLDKGDVIGLIGPNGAGKTTIMKTILGLTKYTGGVFVDNEEVKENDHRALRSTGALIEHPAIYPFMTGLQNLQLYSNDSNDLNEITAELEMGSYINEKSKGYSLGMKQKLGIAIALLNRPMLVILDEPMNGLDIEATVLVRNLIRKYAKQGTSFLISSHILGELEKVIDHVVLIANGQVIRNQSIEDFLNLKSSKFYVSTTDNLKANQLLHDAQINVSLESEQVVIEQKDLHMIEDILIKNKIYLDQVNRKNESLEQIVLNAFSKEAGASNEK